jgi:hypothetical protein
LNGLGDAAKSEPAHALLRRNGRFKHLRLATRRDPGQCR